MCLLCAQHGLFCFGRIDFYLLSQPHSPNIRPRGTQGIRTNFRESVWFAKVSGEKSLDWRGLGWEQIDGSGIELSDCQSLFSSRVEAVFISLFLVIHYSVAVELD